MKRQVLMYGFRRRASEEARSHVLLLRRAEPCAHQRPLRAAWVHVLRAAQNILAKAARRVLHFHLATQARTGPDNNATAHAARHATKFLRRELAAVQFQQLQLLCEKFQLCYHDLITMRKPAHDNLTWISPKAPSMTTSVVELTELLTTTPASSHSPASSPTPTFFPAPSSQSAPKTPISSTYVFTTASLDSSSLPSQVTTTTSSVPPTPTSLESSRRPQMTLFLTQLLRPHSTLRNFSELKRT